MLRFCQPNLFSRPKSNLRVGWSRQVRSSQHSKHLQGCRHQHKVDPRGNSLTLFTQQACLPKCPRSIILKIYSTTLFDQEQKCCKKFRKNNNPNQGQRDLRGWPHLPSSFPKESRGHRGLVHLRLADRELLSPLAEGEEGGQHRQLQLPERASSSATQVQAILTSQGSLQEAYI